MNDFLDWVIDVTTMLNGITQRQTSYPIVVTHTKGVSENNIQAH